MIIISGYTGFIGQNLLSCLDNSRGISLRTANWQDRMDGETIINLVGKAHDHKGEATEKDYAYANVDLSKAVFEAFLNSSASLLIHVSSLAALEEYEADKPLEEMAVCHPSSWYGRSKRTAEEWLLNQKIPAGKKLIILRPPMVHGPGDKGNLGLLYKWVSKGIPYPLASFNNSRSFISIANFCFFIQEIIRKQDQLESGVYHVADDEPVSTKEIFNIIKKVTNKKVINISLPKYLVRTLAKVGDIIPIPLNTKRLKKMTSNLLISNQKIKDALGIEKLPLSAKEGLEKTIRSFGD
ncbi:NAD-dependent epimerase/dehydratase family protein [Sphingobacterium pedocola]|uniref:Epimerase n=1 Tax=Sphingobacterium pedocola TaxID=2082722 RepID=A0ABR9T9Q3_9SPHI|nr:NAD-dependent epimerase/dehydratase family protein [Sphingobacterium pedocola]MBE8722060.1 epimerase [Sphingobacterium pedocola]